MKNIKRSMVIMLVTALFFSFSSVDRKKADAATKLSVKKKTVTVGKIVKIKISGTKKAVKWTVSNKNIKIIKKNKEYAKVKGVKAGKSVLKAKVGKRTYKCRITVKNNIKTTKIPTAEKISYELNDTGKGVLAILTNNNETIANLEAKVVYYKNGSMIGTSSDSNYAFESGTSCALWFDPPINSNYEPVLYDKYEINLSVDSASGNLVYGLEEIQIESNIGIDNVVASIKNNSSKNFEFIRIAVIYYDYNEKVIGYDYQYADCNYSGSTDYLTFSFPKNEEYEIIKPNTYDIYVNAAYGYR